MRPSSSSSDPGLSEGDAAAGGDAVAGGLFDGVLAAGGVRGQVADAAWLRALLDAEAALARAAATVGLIAAADAAAITAACTAVPPDAGEIGREAASSGTPVVPLLRRLRARLPESAASAVHLGATSQDIVDTAAMLVAHRALRPLLADLAAAADLAAGMADRYRDTPTAGRTLLQKAMPTTFGLVAAGWLSGLDRARRRLEAVRADGLAVQLGGAVGTLAAYGSARIAAGAGEPVAPADDSPAADPGVAMVAAFAGELGLAEPALPWHTERTRIADLAGALGAAAGAIAKVARDISLYAQTEVGELAEGDGEGESSTMAHKHNPVRAISAAAAAAQAPGLVATLLAAMPHEYQRAAGAWHAEWRPLRALLESTGSAAYQLRRSLAGLRVDVDRMRANLGEVPDDSFGSAAELVGRALREARIDRREAGR
jgi:3-carboxy-cis,cis-muconate cycloisomerase